MCPPKDAGNLSQDGDGFVWQVGAGLAFQLTPKATLDVGYRYKELADIDSYEETFGGLLMEFSDVETEQHVVHGAIRFEFGGHRLTGTYK